MRDKRHLAFFILLLFTFKTYAQDSKKAITITIKAIEGLQFDKARFAVKPGAQVKVIFENTDDMSHNFVITNPNERLNVLKEAQDLKADDAVKQNYIPKSSRIIFSIPILSPAQKSTATFTAPDKEGVYPYVCTYPGHGYVMYGAMYVTTGKLPAIQNDPNVPESRKNDGTHDDDDHMMMMPKTAAAVHPYSLDPPVLYRVFMPDASPAAIAVNLTGNISYCWDAGSCRLRYAWSGGFVDNTDHWKGNGKFLSKIVGDVFYRDKTNFPFHIGSIENTPAVNFNGYRLLNKYPQFLYTLDGAEVQELITIAQSEGQGLVRTFSVKNLKKTLYFVTKNDDGMTYTSSAGKWEDGILKLTPRQAKNFTITMTTKSHEQHDH